ncbi:MAG: protein kinase [Chlamydiales bacterium]|nr:protein kinase [Chlamydiales bacterium]
MSEPEFHKQNTLPGVKGLPPASSTTEPTPKVIGGYTIEGKYSEGGMSVLYLASHPTTKDPLIIKTLKPHLRASHEVVRKFNNEARILKLSDHPNIVTLYAHEEWEEGPYIALEFIQGRSLHSIIEHNPVSLRRAVEIILEIAYALCHLHTLGVIHRDLKPENILLTEQGTIKLIDLGVAQMLSDADQSPHRRGERSELVGTPIYMSPEQHSNPDMVSYASDIYSLGIIAYELVLGKLSQGQIHLALMPKGLHKILAKALQKRAEDRYQDVVDFITDLSSYLNSASVETERKSADQISELSDHLQQAQMQLLPSQPPHWPELNIGIATYRGISIGGIYYDFFPLPEKRFGIVVAEPSSKGVEGIMYTAVLRGMIRTLCRLTTKPVSLITFLNDLVVRDACNKIFSLSYVVLSPRENRMQVISCGPSNVWTINSSDKRPHKIVSNNPALGVKLFSEFTEVIDHWNVKDMVYIHTNALSSAAAVNVAFDENEFVEILDDFSDLSPQKQAEAIIRRASSKEGLKAERRPISLVTIQRVI